jgi:hypothetical protein
MWELDIEFNNISSLSCINTILFSAAIPRNQLEENDCTEFWWWMEKLICEILAYSYLSFSFIYLENLRITANCTAHKVGSSLSPILLLLIFVCVLNTYVGLYVKWRLCFPMLKKISTLAQIKKKILPPVSMKQHSKESLCYHELRYSWFSSILSSHIVFHWF